MYTASFAFFEALWEAGVSHVFVNLGSDHPSILEAIVKGQKDKAGNFPKIVTCPNEMVALSAAHGMAQVTGQAQAVIVHVDVGTQGLGAAVHNASVGRAPVLIFAGLSPFTCEGEMRGSRTEFIHWTQDVPDQAAIVRQYCRYSGEIKSGKNIKQMVRRAVQFSMSDPQGPTYLCAAREVLEEDITPYTTNPAHWDATERAPLPESAVSKIADALQNAENPLLITSYLGRNAKAVEELVKLADRLPIRVLDTGASDMCFPATHRNSIGLAYGVHPWITKADVILVMDDDVPWIPTSCKPRDDARIFHIDVDPLKQQIPVFYLPAESRYKASSELALRQLNAAFSSLPLTDAHKNLFGVLEKEHKEWMQKVEDAAKPLENGRLTTGFVTSKLKSLLPDDVVYCNEPVTETVNVWNQLKVEKPKSYYNSGAGGLGWFAGAAVGIKLALDKGKPNSGPMVVSVVGDGTFLFAVPGSAYWMAQKYNTPFLTIVLNNKGWNAPLRSALLVHPDGLASEASKEDLYISFDPSPDYAGIARAASGNKFWAGRAATIEEFEKLLPEAVKSVKNGVGAVLEVAVLGFRGY